MMDECRLRILLRRDHLGSAYGDPRLGWDFIRPSRSSLFIRWGFMDRDISLSGYRRLTTGRDYTPSGLGRSIKDSTNRYRADEQRAYRRDGIHITFQEGYDRGDREPIGQRGCGKDPQRHAQAISRTRNRIRRYIPIQENIASRDHTDSRHCSCSHALQGCCQDSSRTCTLIRSYIFTQEHLDNRDYAASRYCLGRCDLQGFSQDVPRTHTRVRRYIFIQAEEYISRRDCTDSRYCSCKQDLKGHSQTSPRVNIGFRDRGNYFQEAFTTELGNRTPTGQIPSKRNSETRSKAISRISERLGDRRNQHYSPTSSHLSLLLPRSTGSTSRVSGRTYQLQYRGLYEQRENRQGRQWLTLTSPE